MQPEGLSVPEFYVEREQLQDGRYELTNVSPLLQKSRLPFEDIFFFVVLLASKPPPYAVLMWWGYVTSLKHWIGYGSTSR